jgi:hypothetical protein
MRNAKLFNENKIRNVKLFALKIVKNAKDAKATLEPRPGVEPTE